MGLCMASTKVFFFLVGVFFGGGSEKRHVEKF